MDEENLKRRYQNFSDKFFGMVYSQQLEVLEAFLKKMIPNLTQGVKTFYQSCDFI